jgi:hypothetical protein
MHAMDEIASQSHNQQQLYWAEIVKLKVASLYICSYRDYLSRWVTGLGIIKAIASSVSIAAWAIWQKYSFVWGLVIAVSQVADALKDVFPFAKKHKAAAQHAITLDVLFIDAQLEWDNIFSGKYSNDQISTRLHKLRKLEHEAERHNFPDGLARRTSLFDQAEKDAKFYFQSTYGVEV